MQKSIAFLIWNTKKSGGNKFIFNLANRLYEKDYQVFIFSVLGGQVDWFPLKIKVKPVWQFFQPNSSSNSVSIHSNPTESTAKTSSDETRKYFYDILIATFWPTAYVALFLPARKKFYFVQNWEASFYKNPFLSFLACRSITFPFQMITISQFLREKIAQFRPDKIEILPVAFDLSVFKSKKQLGRWRGVRSPRGWPNGLPRGEGVEKPRKGKRILSVVSSYDSFKGIKELVWLVKKLKVKLSSWHFVLISFESFPPASVFDEFISAPPRDRLVKEYQKADAFLLTSKVEGFPLPPLEAMACGCPVVMTDSRGVRDYARDAYNCLLAKDEREIVERCLLERIFNDSRLRKRLIQNGLKTAKRYDWKEAKTIAKLEKILYCSNLGCGRTRD